MLIGSTEVMGLISPDVYLHVAERKLQPSLDTTRNRHVKWRMESWNRMWSQNRADDCRSTHNLGQWYQSQTLGRLTDACSGSFAACQLAYR